MLRAGAAALLGLGLLAGVAACAPPTETAPGTGGAGSPVPVSPTFAVEQPGLTPGAGQVDSEWGPIWEAVPEGFPTWPDGTIADVDSPVSLAYTVPAAGTEARDIAQLHADRFAETGLGGGLDGPLEDGSWSAWASNGYGCDIRVSVLPRGGIEHLVTVLYGAGCPFEWAQG